MTKSKLVELLNKYKWTNIFVRDILLILVVIWINEALDYNSWFAAVLVGMMIVLVTWHLNDLLKEKRRLDDGIYRHDDSLTCPSGLIHNNLQQDTAPEHEGYTGGDKGID